MRGFIKRKSLVNVAVLALVIGLITYGVVKASTMESKDSYSNASSTPAVMTYEEFFNMKLAAEKNRKGFREEMEKYEDKQARINVLNALISKVEQTPIVTATSTK